PFITMAYGLLNHETGVVRLARAGHPYPLHLPRVGEPVLWRPEGLLLGVADAAFREAEYRLAPGDRLLLYSDGVEAARFADRPTGADSLLACAVHHRGLSLAALVGRLADDLFGEGERADD